MNSQSPFWNLSGDEVLQQMHSTIAGLSRQNAKQRLCHLRFQLSTALFALFVHAFSPLLIKPFVA